MKWLLVFSSDNAGDCILETCDPDADSMLAVTSDAMSYGAEGARRVKGGDEARELLEHFDKYSLGVDDDVRAHILAMP